MIRWFASALMGLFALTAVAHAAAPPAPQQTAVFAGGCFWCMEHDMKAIPGVVSVESGYTGGTVDRPTYEEVSSETTGHYESVRVTYDPSKIDYGYLLTRYWKLVDPTDDGGQFCDRGPSYRSAIFVSDPTQRKLAEASKIEAQTHLNQTHLNQAHLRQARIVTQILPLHVFWPAEAYHRDYAHSHALHYTLYRQGCGRDARLAEVWGR